MKLTRCAIVLAAVVTSVQTLAETLENYDVMTTGDLIKLCSVGADAPSYGAAMGFCLGVRIAQHAGAASLAHASGMRDCIDEAIASIAEASLA